jgi:hypothetical protein
VKQENTFRQNYKGVNAYLDKSYWKECANRALQGATPAKEILTTALPVH